MSVAYSFRASAVLMLANVAGMIDLVALLLSIGSLVQHYGLDLQRAGLTITAFLLGVVAASMTLALRFNWLPRRSCAIAGYALVGCQWRTAPWPLGQSTPAVRVCRQRLRRIHRCDLCTRADADGAIGRGRAPRDGRPDDLRRSRIAGLPQREYDCFDRCPKGRAGRFPSLMWLMVGGVACLGLNQSIMFSFLERIGMAAAPGTKASMRCRQRSASRTCFGR